MRACLAGWVGVILASGCLAAPGAQPPDGPKGGRQPKQSDIDRAQRLQFTAGFAGGIPGAPLVSYELVLNRGGPCRAVVTRGNNYDSRDRTVTHYELPAGTFEECLSLVRSTGFLRMKSAQPEVLFENSSKGVSLAWDGGSHGVSVIFPATAPAGFDALYDFAAAVEKHGKKVKTQADPEVPQTPLPPPQPPGPSR